MTHPLLADVPVRTPSPTPGPDWAVKNTAMLSRILEMQAVPVTHYMTNPYAEVDGGTDNTAAYLAALDAANGQFPVVFPPMPDAYRLDKAMVNHPGSAVIVPAGAKVQKIGTVSGSLQGVLNVIATDDVTIIIGGTLDGGKTSLGSTYTGGSAVNGVFGLRSLRLRTWFLPGGKITGCTDDGVKYRNCADSYLPGDGLITDCWNNGVEFSFVAAASDHYADAGMISEAGSRYNSGAGVPAYVGYGWDDLVITDVQDGTYAAEGTGLVFAFSSTDDVSNRPRRIYGRRLRAERCNRGFHYESNLASWYLDGADFGTVEAFDCRRDGISLIGGHSFTADVFRARNCGVAGALSEAGDAEGVILNAGAAGSSAFQIGKLIVIDDRASATDYAKIGVLLSGPSDFTIGQAYINAGSLAQMRWTALGGTAMLGPTILRKTATPATSVGGLDITDASPAAVSAYFASLDSDHATPVNNLGHLVGWRGIVKGQTTQ